MSLLPRAGTAMWPRHGVETEPSTEPASRDRSRSPSLSLALNAVNAMAETVRREQLSNDALRDELAAEKLKRENAKRAEAHDAGEVLRLRGDLDKAEESIIMLKHHS